MKHMRNHGDGRRAWLILGLGGLLLFVILPLLNALPVEGSWWRVSDFSLNLLGKFLAYAILALGIDLIWGYAGILSLGHGVFFGLGAYCMGMHLSLAIGTQGVYQSALPDFMVWNQVQELPAFWRPFYHFWWTLPAVILVPCVFALLFGVLAFRSRITGVYFSIITQALALSVWLLFNRNETDLGGTNGLTGFKTLLGFRLSDPATQRVLYMASACCLGGAYLLCRWMTRSRLGKVLVAIRDSEQRVLFTGYSPADYKLFVFVVSAGLAGLAGALYVPQVGIITPAQLGVLPSLEMVVWVAAGGRGSLVGAILGAVGVNGVRSVLTTQYPDLWPFFLGGLFIGVVLLLPEGCIGFVQRVRASGRRYINRRSRQPVALISDWQRREVP